MNEFPDFHEINVPEGMTWAALADSRGEFVDKQDIAFDPDSRISVTLHAPAPERPVTRSNDILVTVQSCIVANVERIRKGMENPLQLRVPLYLLQVGNPNVPSEITWGGFDYEIKGDLDALNFVMRSGVAARLSTTYKPIESPQSFERRIESSYAADVGAKLVQRVEQIELNDEWTIDTVYTTYHPERIINEKKPAALQYFVESWACPPSAPIAASFYRDSGKGNAAETVNELTDQTLPSLPAIE